MRSELDELDRDTPDRWLLSHALNLGLLHPKEVCDAVAEAYRAGDVPVNAAEGFIRQIIGWREYLWGVYHRWMPEYAHSNALGADLDVPPAFTDWMHASFIDAYDWVMVPNVIGMGTFADGGRMSNKPNISGGAYINKMSDGYCIPCRYDPKERIGEDACPFTSLYGDVLDRTRDVLQGNHRLHQPYAALGRLEDIEELRERAIEVRRQLAAGEL